MKKNSQTCLQDFLNNWSSIRELYFQCQKSPLLRRKHTNKQDSKRIRERAQKGEISKFVRNFFES